MRFTEAQIRAIEHPNENLQLIACAGSGENRSRCAESGRSFGFGIGAAKHYRVPTEAQPLWFLWNLHGEEFLKTLPPPPRQMKLF